MAPFTPPITRQDILVHQETVPWPSLLQVEQDLLLSLSMVALFEDRFLSDHIAMRGGTALHKVHLAPPARYSEDIDLVVVTDRDENHIRAAVKRVLLPILGRHKGFGWESVRLAIRNAARPSRILKVDFETASVAEPGRTIKIKLEANVTERQSYLPTTRHSFTVSLPSEVRTVELASYDINEMLGTKMRALFQRSQGRDLFDLYWALTTPDAGINPAIAIDAFNHYMAAEKQAVQRAGFEEALTIRLADPHFRADMAPLLRHGLAYDVDEAGARVRRDLLRRLPA
ncbi:nucleotidyl transferase AbiEii/AbiGii toxin family protein [Pelagibius sp. 7325]|uniref:nucleotidyl transferase AbiEii/AbiGii toxin family protein n=1 Tax=Pelagibius sp. 7325 TaxID=3131994 RepID=UPI0030EDD993